LFEGNFLANHETACCTALQSILRAGFKVLAEVHAQSAAPAFGENVEIAAGLGRLDDAERYISGRARGDRKRHRR